MAIPRVCGGEEADKEISHGAIIREAGQSMGELHRDVWFCPSHLANLIQNAVKRVQSLDLFFAEMLGSWARKAQDKII